MPGWNPRSKVKLNASLERLKFLECCMLETAALEVNNRGARCHSWWRRPSLGGVFRYPLLCLLNAFLNPGFVFADGDGKTTITASSKRVADNPLTDRMMCSTSAVLFSSTSNNSLAPLPEYALTTMSTTRHSCWWVNGT